VYIAIILLFLNAVSAAALTLVADGKSTYSIVLERGASPSMQRGAQELQRFIEEMSGAKLPIVEAARGDAIVLSANDSLGPEAYRIRTQGKRLTISGGRQRGVMYGAYALLEKLGCRWFTPEVSRIPKQRTLSIPSLDESAKPAFEYREPFFTEAFDKDWAARNRTNGANAKLDESTGGKLTYHPFVHSFYSMIPPEQHFKDHPEYFSLIDGKRRWERGQLCLTNRDVVRLGIEAVERWIREHPEAKLYSVSQNDWTGWCECDNCRRVEEEEGGVHSGPLLRYVNEVASEIGKRHPDKLIDTLAYWYTESPPLKARPVKNVRIRLCPIGVCEAHPYESCPHSAYFVNNLRAWSKITQQLYIWHYNTNFSHYLLPFPDFDELAANIPLYARSGVVGVFLEGAYGEGGGGENAELRSYVMAKQLWDPTVSVDRTVNEFLEGVYGPSAKAMREYYDLMHQQVRPAPQGRGQHLWIFIHPNSPYLMGDFIPRAREILRQAEQAAGSDSALRRRVRKARLPIDYVELSRAKTFQVDGDVYQPRDLSGLKDRFSTFIETVRSYGIARLHEHRKTEEDVKEFEYMMKPYQAQKLENAQLRIHVVPELSGRIISMLDKTTNTPLLREADPGEGNYPDAGGLGLWIYPDYHGRSLPVKWTVETASTDQLILAGSGDGLKVRRTLRLNGPQLLTNTEITNTGTEPRTLALQSRAEYSPGLAGDSRIAYGWGSVSKAPISAGVETSGNESPKIEELNGAWWAGHAGSPVRLENMFQQSRVPRATVNWSVRGDNRVTLTLWSEERTVKPGESFSFETTYRPVSN